MMDSLRRVLALEPRVLFCQHRGRVEQGAARLRDKLDFLVELGERIHELHGRGWSHAAIARALPGSDLLWRGWAAGGASPRATSAARPGTPPGPCAARSPPRAPLPP